MEQLGKRSDDKTILKVSSVPNLVLTRKEREAPTERENFTKFRCSSFVCTEYCCVSDDVEAFPSWIS